jgi:hypothetical protein
MKKIPFRIVVLVSLCAISASMAFSGLPGDEIWFKGATVAAIEQNLAIGLSTHNAGLRASASQVVRDLKALLPNQEFSLLVIPLMGIVKDGSADIQVRMIGALALHDLRSAKGDFAIERLARFESNPRLKNLCTWLTYERLSQRENVASPISLPLN